MVDPKVQLAREYLRPFERGGSRPILMVIADVGPALVKFQGNPQGPRLLPNEIIGFGIADLLGIDHPDVGFVRVEATVLPSDGRLIVEPNHDRDGAVFGPGLQFYSRMLEPSDWLTIGDLAGTRLTNGDQFAGILLLDLLLGHFDRKVMNPNLLVYHSAAGYLLRLIDLGHLAGSAVWELGNLHDPSLPEASNPLPYDPTFQPFIETIRDPFTAFLPWLKRLGDITSVMVEGVVETVLHEWALSDTERAAVVGYIMMRARSLPAYILDRTAKAVWWK